MILIVGGYHVHALHIDSIRELARTEAAKARVTIARNPAQKHYYIGATQLQKAEFVGFFEGQWQNPRQIAQQGFFMITSKIDLDVHHFLTRSRARPDPHGNAWLIFEFGGGRRFHREIVKNLLSANVTAASLFPGLEGLAQSMYMRMYEAVRDLD